ncbi:hypothetical protein LVY65_01045 [Sphingomonas sp. G124]|uniref:Peptidase S24/S26A/S26B/S26C domain-containing protein n=1 Tax=Sphingomonas cremea TaxID=2904799 RepID=A0A9X1TW30_9SPHN|nr:S24 family peptidase [Sphingomonas cremea]MCF2513655.1 hypothetical protein [Sphingomonas cremea]
MSNDGTQLIDDLMRFLPNGMTANSWAVKAGVSRTIWADIKRHGNPSRRTLEKLMTAVGSSLAEFEALRIGAGSLLAEHIPAIGVGDARRGAWRPAPLEPIPLYEASKAGEWGVPGSGIELTELSEKIGDWLPRPVGLAGDGDVYAVPIPGQSMWPRFRPGRRLLVSPAAPVEVGDDVLVRLVMRKGRQGPVLIKELTRRSAGHVELRQFNPDISFRVGSAEIASVHKVVGEAI